MRKVQCILLSLIMTLSYTINIHAIDNTKKFILGGNYVLENNLDDNLQLVDSNISDYNLERFFRPSNMTILNDENLNSLKEFYDKNPYKINLPNNAFRSGKDTVVNYFNVLREASNPTSDNEAGCGTIGDAKGPYPVAYNFLSDSFKKKISYENFLNSFENILHINLIKVNNVPSDEDNPYLLKYFVELEVIEGTTVDKGLFAYYYGNIYLRKEGEKYKIVKMDYSPENYLCAPYHGWSYDAKSFVEVEYGNWCSLVEGDVIVNEEGYEKRAYYKDKNDKEYYVLFYELTNGVDKKIADYKKNENNEWEVIYIYPEKCLKNK